jgi:Kef-type K+ transport system membrane component KefB
VKRFIGHVYHSVLYQLLLGALVRYFWGHTFPVEYLAWTSIAVIGLFHLVGLQMNFKTFRDDFKLSFLVILATTILPVVFFWLIALSFGMKNISAWATATILITTGTGVTIQTLANMNLLNSKPGQFLIMVSALDDIPAALIMAYILQSGGHLPAIAFGMQEFVALGILVGTFVFMHLISLKMKWLIAIASFAFAIASSFILDNLSISPVMAGLLSGIVLSLILQNKARSAAGPLGLILRPILPLYIFTVGMKLGLDTLRDLESLGFTLVMIVAAVTVKYGGAYMVLRNRKDLVPRLVSWGLVPRGIPGFAFASASVAAGLISESVFTSLIVVITITTWLGLYGLERTAKRMNLHE